MIDLMTATQVDDMANKSITTLMDMERNEINQKWRHATSILSIGCFSNCIDHKFSESLNPYMIDDIIDDLKSKGFTVEAVDESANVYTISC